MDFKNNRTGDTVSLDMPLAEIARQFAATAGSDHWVWFWLAKTVKDSQGQPERRNMIAFLADSFLYAIGQGLKRPMIRFQVGDRRYKVYLSRRGTLCFKSGAVIPGTSDPEGDEEYIGCLYQGRFLPNKERKILPEEQDALDGLAADPVGFLAARSKDMDRCCYCNLPLEDKRSKDVGYGSTCAKRWGLPWGKTYDEKVPSFAQIWGRAGGSEQRNVRMLCRALRQTPRDATLWAVLGDALEEAGFPPDRRPTIPEEGVIFPQPDPVEPMPVPEPKPVAVPEPKPAPTKSSTAFSFSSTKFTWNKATKTFSVDVSDIGGEALPRIGIVSAKTGNTAYFDRVAVSKDMEGDVVQWEYSGPDGMGLLVAND